MTVSEIPTKPGRPQRFKVTLSGVDYIFALAWNPASACWVLEVYNGIDQSPILRGVPLITGANLLDQYQYLGIGARGDLVAITIGVGHSPDEVPTFANLGIDGHLFYVTRA